MLRKSFFLIAFRNLLVNALMRWLGGRWGGSSSVVGGDLGGITAAHEYLVQVMYMIGWYAANQASLVLTRRRSHAGSSSLSI